MLFWPLPGAGVEAPNTITRQHQPLTGHAQLAAPARGREYSCGRAVFLVLVGQTNVCMKLDEHLGGEMSKEKDFVARNGISQVVVVAAVGQQLVLLAKLRADLIRSIKFHAPTG